MDNDQRKQGNRFIRPNMDPQKLQHFLAVYQHGNFHRAADACNVTQQAVSKAIARLENQLDLQLFERNTLGVAPTSYAHALARHAKTILAEIHLASAELMAMRGAKEGFLQVGIGWSFHFQIGPEAIKRFHEQRPGIGLRITGGSSTELFPKLLQGELDFAVSAPPNEYPIDKGIRTQPLYHEQDRVLVGCQHPLAKKSHVTLEDLSKHTWLMDLSSRERWHAICEVFVQGGVAPPRDIIDLNSLSLAKSMLLQGDYVCLFSEELCVSEIKLGLLKALETDLITENRTAVIATRVGSQLQPVAEVLRDIILSLCLKNYPVEEFD